MWTNQQFSGDWALNPSAYKNVSHEDVDWASLAQQWIKMKEATTALITPPPPPISANSIVDKNDEEGEAPMDMETDDKPESAADPSTWSNWPEWQQSWGWNWNSETNSSEQGSVTKEPYGYTSTFAPGDNSATIDYNHGAGPENQPVYWTGQAAGAPDVSSQKDSKPYIRSSRYTWRRSDRDRDRDKDRTKDRDLKDDGTLEEDSTDTLDAAKRKQLPLWIREGLEKMEREKQRKIDKEKADKERDEYLRRKKAEDEVALSKMDSVEAAKFMARSKFDSDGSEGEQEKIAVVRHRKSRFHEEERPNTGAHSSSEIKKEKSKTPPPIEPVKTREEMLEDLMMNVRRTLTEILLDITTEEIETISRQVYQKARSKAPAKRLRKSQAFASIAEKSGLGLGIYGSDDETDSDDSNGSIHKAGNSDDELDEVIRQKKESFAKTEAEIEAQLEAEDARERMSREVVNTSEDESDADVGQVEHISHVHDSKKDVSRSRGIEEDDSGKRRKKASESQNNSELLREESNPNDKKNKNNDFSDSSSSTTSGSSAKRASFKRKRKRSTDNGDEKVSRKKSETSDDENERSKRKAKKKKHNSADENNSKDEETEQDDYKRKNKTHDHEKRHKKNKKIDKEGKRDNDRGKKSSHRSSSRGSEDHHRSKRRSKSQDLDRRTRRRSRPRDNEHRRRNSRSREEHRRRRSRSYDSGSRKGRSRELEHRRNRSRSKESHRRQLSKSRESNQRRKRSHSKEKGRKHGRRRGRSSS